MLKRYYKVCIVAFIAVLVLATSFFALHSKDSSAVEIWSVSDETDLQKAVSMASSGGTIIVTLNIDLTERIYISNKEITIEALA